MLIHFLGAIFSGINYKAGIKPTRKRPIHHLLGASSNKTDIIMNTVENQQAVPGHKAVKLRRSVNNLTEQSRADDVGSAAMSRQSSNQSHKSTDATVEKMATGEPSNFGTVAPGVYRSSYPQEANYPFLRQLKLKTIM